jgi:hypothetical protein
MNNNQKTVNYVLEFYTHLIYVLEIIQMTSKSPKQDFNDVVYREHVEDKIQDIVDSFEWSKGKISVPNVTKENIQKWVSSLENTEGEYDWDTSKCENLWGRGCSAFDIILGAAFCDLHAQMRNKEARNLYTKMKEVSLSGDDLSVHIRKTKKLSRGISEISTSAFAAVTVVTDNLELLRNHLMSAEGTSYKIYFSESGK